MASIRQRGKSYQITVCNGYATDGTKITETTTFTPDPAMKVREIKVALKGCF